MYFRQTDRQMEIDSIKSHFLEKKIEKKATVKGQNKLNFIFKITHLTALMTRKSLKKSTPNSFDTQPKS